MAICQNCRGAPLRLAFFRFSAFFENSNILTIIGEKFWLFNANIKEINVTLLSFIIAKDLCKHSMSK